MIRSNLFTFHFYGSDFQNLLEIGTQNILSYKFIFTPKKSNLTLEISTLKNLISENFIKALSYISFEVLDEHGEIIDKKFYFINDFRMITDGFILDNENNYLTYTLDTEITEQNPNKE